MRVITLAGSPRFPSHSTALLSLCQQALEARGVEVIPWNIHNFQPEDLLYARFDLPALKADLLYVGSEPPKPKSEVILVPKER